MLRRNRLRPNARAICDTISTLIEISSLNLCKGRWLQLVLKLRATDPRREITLKLVYWKKDLRLVQLLCCIGAGHLYLDYILSLFCKETIVLIHGNFLSIKWWDDAVDSLKDLGNRIIVMDLRRFGRSSDHQKVCRFNDWACDVIELLKILKVEKVILNGWNFGGAMSQKVAELTYTGLKADIGMFCFGWRTPVQKFRRKGQLRLQNKFFNRQKLPIRWIS